MTNKPYFCRNSLEIELFVIGFKYEGESIVFLVKCDGGVCFSGLIDCYETEQHLIENILKNNNVESLNFICWTHPDMDHSKGIRYIVNKFSKEITNLWIPENVEFIDRNCGKKIKNFFTYIRQNICKKNTKFKVYTVSDYKNLMAYNPIEFNYRGCIYNLNIHSLAPSSYRIKSMFYRNNYCKNDRSIVLHINMGKINLFFTGDIENGMILEMPTDYIPKNNDFIKIPHHGSTSSDALIDKIGGNNAISCSTVYRRGKINLPDQTIMGKYKIKSERLVCTGKVDSAKEKHKYGVAKFKFDILNLLTKVSFEGNAGNW